MYARVWRAGILPGKVDDFVASIDSMRPLLRGRPGFRGLIVLHSGPGEALETTIVSMWASIDELRGSETPEYQQALVKVVACCERHPVMREEEVLMSDFPQSAHPAHRDPNDTVTSL